MATFHVPIAGTNLSVEPPRRTLLDESGHRAVLLSEVTAQGNVTVVAPITSYATTIQVGTGFLLQLSPLPAAATVLNALGSAPTFYVGGAGIDQNTASGTIGAGETITVDATISIGATCGPFALAPREWARLLQDAMAAAGEADLGPWNAFRSALGTGPALYVLRHTGQPPAPNTMRFDVELPGNPPTAVAINDGGDLAAAAPGIFAPGARVRLQTTVGGIPYHTAYDTDTRSSAEPDAPADDRWFEPSALPRDVATILCTDLNGWFGARPAGIPLPRWHTGNRVEPLLDGIEYFKRLWDDLQPLRTTNATAATNGGPPYGLWMAGLGFKNFELVPGTTESKFVDLVKELDQRGIEVRLLGAKGFMAEVPDDELERTILAIALVLMIAGIGVAHDVLEGTDFEMSDVTWSRLTLLAIIAMVIESTQIVDQITDKLDFSKDVFEALAPSANEARLALWSRYPARFSDNPAADYPAAVVEQLVSVERTGYHHMKLAALSLPGQNDATPNYVAYVGGIDINANRIDSWAHRWPPNYHDLHARVTGPAAADVFQTFYERWEDELDRLPAEEAPAAPNGCPRFRPRPGLNPPHTATPTLSAIPRTDDDHIVQIARTLYRPAPANASEGFWYAPQGEASVHDSVLRAIQSASEYIYIEDQYMTPADSGGQGAEIMEALVAAATRCKALILVFSQGTAEQLFGNERRNALFGQLQTAWIAQPGRVFLPMIHSRQLLGAPDNVAAKGRTVLKEPVAATATLIRIADSNRIPDAPCWAWIEGELVLVQDVTVVNVDASTKEAVLEVARAPAKHLDSSARAHEAGAPVTFVTLDDVFIHAKLVLIDDAYASIGSANMNRRSMFHDGEMNAMVVPGRLRAAVDNPVRSIRCRLWADHLGLPPQLAESELADPIAALRHFQRPRAAGNPLSPHDLFDDMAKDGLEIQTKGAIEKLQTVLGGLAQVSGDVAKEAVWRTLIDPTTSLDPFPDAPPFP